MNLYKLAILLLLLTPAIAAQPMHHGSGMGTSMMQDLGPADKQYDLRFLNAMIEHHEGALVMAQDALKKSKRPEVQKLAKAIVAAQQKEIAQMKAWRQAWYAQ